VSSLAIEWTRKRSSISASAAAIRSLSLRISPAISATMPAATSSAGEQDVCALAADTAASAKRAYFTQPRPLRYASILLHPERRMARGVW
jgi:hypothetical protein